MSAEFADRRAARAVATTQPVHLPGAALLLAAAVLASVSAARAETPAFPDGIGGDDVAGLVTDALTAQGLHATPAISGARRYPACDHAPAVAPRNGDWSTVELTCTAPTDWTRAVRTGIPADRILRGPIQVTAAGPRVAHLRTSLAEGAVITAADIELADASAGIGTGAFSDLAAVIGRKLKTNLGEGQVVLARHLEQNWLITAGTPVAITYQGGALDVLAPGEALQDGQHGELIEVRNRASGRVIKGYVAGRNKVHVHSKLN